MKKKGIPGDEETARRVRMARGAGNLTLGQLAEKVSEILNVPLSREIIRRVELAERDAEIRLLAAIAMATGESFEWLAEPLAKQATDYRGLNGAKGAYHHREWETTGLSREEWADSALILQSDHGLRSRVGHALGDCLDCLLDPNYHVRTEWLTPGGQIPGQTELIIDIEKMLEEVA
jgi:transcriptional regulator with XRE-family HTH domain